MSRQNFWHLTAKQVKFFVVDATACFPLLLWILHAREWTLYTALVSIVVLGLLGRFGYRPGLAWLRVRFFLATLFGRRPIRRPDHWQFRMRW